jgi:hypothetical protein
MRRECYRYVTVATVLCDGSGVAAAQCLFLFMLAVLLLFNAGAVYEWKHPQLLNRHYCCPVRTMITVAYAVPCDR